MNQVLKSLVNKEEMHLPKRNSRWHNSVAHATKKLDFVQEKEGRRNHLEVAKRTKEEIHITSRFWDV